MPPRQTPTARQIRLGAELRKLREQAGLTAREAGEMIGANQARISNIETGRFGLS
jgi:transcriptional regulator with XRE-family HTH domain